jgi:6-phosphogluconolactonase (cycloisomerase 2 family)
MSRIGCVAVLISLSLLLAGCGSSSLVSSGNTPTTPTTGSTPPPAGGSSGGGTGGSGGSTGGGGSSAPIAFAYVGTSVGQSGSAIHGFSFAANGSATPVPGSPVSGPSNDVVTNSAFVFGDDSHTIASYKRAADGSLQQSSSLFAVLNNGPGQLWALSDMSLDHTGQTLYAVENAGADDLYYFFFGVGSDGKLTNTGKIGPNVNYDSPLVFSPDNNYAYGFGCFHIGWDLTGFRRNGDGSLTPIGGTNQAVPTFDGTNQDYCPEAEAISAMGYLAVGVGELGATPKSGLGVYKINSDGSLTLVQNSTMTLQLQSSSCCGFIGMNFDPSGQFLAVAGSGGIQMFRLSSDGTLSALGGIQQPGPNYLSVAWDKDSHLYAVAADGLHVFTVSQGTLAPAGSPQPAGAAGSLAVLPTH